MPNISDNEPDSTPESSPASPLGDWGAMPAPRAGADQAEQEEAGSAANADARGVPPQGPDSTQTAVFPPVTAGDTQVMPPVAPGQDADAEGAGAGAGDAGAADGAATDDAEADDAAVNNADESRRNSLGVWSVVTGALLLFPVAIVLGHLGLRANKRGEANNRPVALAGVILGYVGLAAAIAGVAIALFVVSPNMAAQDDDNAAKVDVINIGSAAVAQSSASDQLPEVTTVDGGYAVGDTSLPAELEVPGTVTLDGSSASDWCLVLSYEGGNDSAVAYSSTSGLVDGATCS
ncbi:DUF4190 domain-containing protein [Demequina aurantiaca]|uniref:DUF4190 domain-containing protein n=1 Tax=Demequina aurantiaca TaxID=676200 RepID=UPI003D327D5E